MTIVEEQDVSRTIIRENGRTGGKMRNPKYDHRLLRDAVAMMRVDDGEKGMQLAREVWLLSGGEFF